MRQAVINSSSVVGYNRLDGKFHLSEGLTVRRIIKACPYGTTTISDVTKDIYCPGIFKRNYANGGYMFLGGKDIQKAELNSGKYLRKENTPNWEILTIKKGWSLVTCGGTIGDVVFANEILSKCWASQHVMRVIPNQEKIKEGMLYSYLATRYGKLLLTTGTYGSVIPTISSDNISVLPIPNFSEAFQSQIDDFIQRSAALREEANAILVSARKRMIDSLGIGEISLDEYDFYGPCVPNRKVSCFIVPRKNIDEVSINAFNHSERIRNLKNRLSSTIKTRTLISCLNEEGLFSTGSFPRVEVKPPYGVELINQRDIFDSVVRGKHISKRGVKLDNLLSRDEIVIAGVGTLGESETFCRCIYANSYLAGKLISGEFIRMKSNEQIPSGYLFLWLSSDYGFRLIRNTHTGAKLCRPIPKLLELIPVPELPLDEMLSLDALVKESQEKFAQASFAELEAIALVEAEIEKWNN